MSVLYWLISCNQFYWNEIFRVSTELSHNPRDLNTWCLAVIKLHPDCLKGVVFYSSSCVMLRTLRLFGVVNTANNQQESWIGGQGGQIMDANISIASYCELKLHCIAVIIK